MTLSHRKYVSLQLSLYIDGQLDARERQEIERRIADDPSVRREFEELRALRALLADRQPLPENPFLPEKVMNRIRIEAEKEDSALPVPRRFMPAVAGLVMVVIVAVSIFTWLQREDLFHYLEDTGTQVQLAYEESGLKGWIMPLFEQTDRDKVLQFAMFGTLPLDDEDGTVLRVDEHADSGYRVELARDTAGGIPRATLDQLYQRIKPSDTQRRVFDTLFSYAQKQIESSVLMNENREIAIDPAISKYHKVILSGIAASLEPEQLVRFEEFLRSRNTPYTFVSRTAHDAPSPPPPRRVIDHFRTVRMPEEFVVFTRDSIAYAHLHLDMDSLRSLMKVMENRIPRLEVRVNDLARTVAVRGKRSEAVLPRPAVRVMSRDGTRGEHIITISIQSDAAVMREMEAEMQQMMRQVTMRKRDKDYLVQETLRHVAPRHAAPQHAAPREANRPDRSGTQYPADTEIRVTVNIDSIVMRMHEDFDGVEL
ncbi:MAG: hypothetical protein RRA94_15835, partial [Bacteroidota bacterium]|nr:hypothetical protein [Bacteroidota bacterium]